MFLVGLLIGMVLGANVALLVFSLFYGANHRA
jgi:hypothetical protein